MTFASPYSGTSVDVSAIKAALNDRAEDFARYLFPAGRKNGHDWQVGSINGEQGQSFKVCIEGSKVGAFREFAGDEGGSNLVELYMQARRVSFKDALYACAEWLGVSLDSAAPPVSPQRSRRNPIVPTTPKQPVEIYAPSDDERATAIRMAETLITDAALRERIAKGRGWRADTLLTLARECYLGWDNGKLAFIYDTGVKLRWRKDDERVIRWAFGSPWVWRGAWIASATTVYLTEGETDCIALIDAGAENEAGTVAVALPSATGFKDDWAALFRGKDVILALDGDKAGWDATARISRILARHAKSLCRLNWEGLRNAS